MTIDEILEHQQLKLPKNWKELGYDSYFQCVTREGLKHLKLLDELDDEIFELNDFPNALTKRQLKNISKKIYIAVLNTLKTYLDKGDPHEAYNVFDKYFYLKKDVIKRYDNLSYYLDFIRFQEKSNYYRLRENEGDLKLNEIFHVPFHLRHKINSFRYSIPGFPTLYISNSLYLAYKELGDPDYNNLYVSKFKFTDNSGKIEHLLDMRSTPGPFEDDKILFLARWILTMACSIKAGHPKEPFKVEYILPQIILQWVKSHISFGVSSKRAIGVCYSSTKTTDSFNGNYYNLAIPIKQSSKKGFCDILSKQFCLTNPIQFNDALGQEIKGGKVDYSKTDFAKIEQVLNSPPHSELFFINGKNESK